MGFIFSFSIIKAKNAAKIGAIYLMDTAVPIAIYFKDKKNNVIEMKPNTLRVINKDFLFPIIEILFLSKNGIVKNNEPIALKNTI
ncbi:hypothetical protein FBALC1_06938 [Flavobacteriales bacterium ALC-1]|nr:hypothetical protein FBALC1_06938 [Flavobacteriales bacterium ALC-1]